MRLLLLAAMVGVFTSAPLFAQEAVIVQKEVDVRSGPATKFYATSKLYQNDKVLVLRESKESPGWVEIKPPAGSFSWINAKYVKRVDQKHGFVECDPSRPVSVLPGSRLVNQAPDRESVKLTAGTIVVLVNPPMLVDGETWLPVEPHSSEVRYIPKEAVNTTPATAVNVATPNWTQTSSGYQGNSVLAEAEQALKNNDLARAKQLYQIVANNATDQNQKVFAMNRLDSLSRLTVQGTTTSLSPGNQTPTAPVNVQTVQGPNWSTYGRVSTTGLKSEAGQPIYILEDAQSKRTYFTTIPGKSLEMYVGRIIAVYGPTQYRADVRMQYIVASHVAMP